VRRSAVPSLGNTTASFSGATSKKAVARFSSGGVLLRIPSAGASIFLAPFPAASFAGYFDRL